MALLLILEKPWSYCTIPGDDEVSGGVPIVTKPVSTYGAT